MSWAYLIDRLEFDRRNAGQAQFSEHVRQEELEMLELQNKLKDCPTLSVLCMTACIIVCCFTQV